MNHMAHLTHEQWRTLTANKLKMPGSETHLWCMCLTCVFECYLMMSVVILQDRKYMHQVEKQ